MSVNGMETRDELQTKNKRLLGEIDALQTQTFTQSEQLRQMKEIIEEKRHTQQLAGWAIDRALEIAKLNGDKVASGNVIETAEKLCAWVHASSAREPKTDDAQETVN